MTTDHTGCTITTTVEDDGETYEQHDCPICPHGLFKGYQFKLSGDPESDAAQRRLKDRRLEILDCLSPEHTEALARQSDEYAEGLARQGTED